MSGSEQCKIRVGGRWVYDGDIGGILETRKPPVAEGSD